VPQLYLNIVQEPDYSAGNGGLMGAEQLLSNPVEFVRGQVEENVLNFEDKLFEAQQNQLLRAEKVLEEKNKQPGEKLRLPVDQYREAFLYSDDLLAYSEVVAENEGTLELLLSSEALAEIDPNLIEVFGELGVEAQVHLQQDEFGEYVLQEVNLLINWVHNTEEEVFGETVEVSTSEKFQHRGVYHIERDAEGNIINIELGEGAVALEANDESSPEALAGIERLREMILAVAMSGEAQEEYTASLIDGRWVTYVMRYELDANGDVVSQSWEVDSSWEEILDLHDAGVLHVAFDETGGSVPLLREPLPEEFFGETVATEEFYESTDDSERVGEFVESTVDTSNAFEVKAKSNEGRGFTAKHMKIFTLNRENSPIQTTKGVEYFPSQIKKPTIVAQSLVTNSTEKVVPAGGFQLRVVQGGGSKEPSVEPVKTVERKEVVENKPAFKDKELPKKENTPEQVLQTKEGPFEPKVLAITQNTEEVQPHETALLYVEVGENIWQEVANETEAEELVLSMVLERVEDEVVSTIDQSTHSIELAADEPDAEVTMESPKISPVSMEVDDAPVQPKLGDALAIPQAEQRVVSRVVSGVATDKSTVTADQKQEISEESKQEEEKEVMHTASGSSSAFEEIKLSQPMQVGEEMTFSYQAFALHKKQEQMKRGGARRSSSSTTTSAQVTDEDEEITTAPAAIQPVLVSTTTSDVDASSAPTERRTQRRQAKQEAEQALAREVEGDVYRIPPGLKIRGLNQLAIPDQTIAVEKIRSLSEEHPGALPSEARIERTGSEYQIIFDGEPYALAA
jgi:hypothetical protein